MRFRQLPFLLALLALGVLPASAQGVPSRHNRFSIAGNVRDEVDHHAVENVLVTLKSETGMTVATTYTQGNGDFLFEAVGNGNYILDIDVKDYDRVQQPIAISGNSRMGLSIFLAKSGRAANPAMQMTISAHQLSVPHKAHDEFEKGESLIYTKMDYRAAIAQFQVAIKDFPNYYEAYGEEGNAYYILQEMGPAEEALQKSIELSSGKYADSIFTLAALMTDTKRYTQAEKLARQGIAADSSSWRGPFELARALTALKQPEEAEKNAQRARDLMPDNAPIYLLMANIHIQRKDYPALLRDLDDYLRLAPTGPEADQARKTKERVQAILNAHPSDSAGSGDDDTSNNDDDADTPPDKEAAPQPAPDTSGLPTLPPPTPPNK